MPASLSDYTARLVDPVAQPPWCLEDVKAFFFELNVNKQALARICDEHLNEALEPHGISVRPRGDVVIVAFSHFPTSFSRTTPEAGSIDYTEVAFLFTVRVEADGKEPETAFYVPALFLDGPPASGVNPADAAYYPIAAGRELYGLPKTRAKIGWNETNLGEWAKVQVFDVASSAESSAPIGPQTLIEVKATLPGTDEVRGALTKTERQRHLDVLLGCKPKGVEWNGGVDRTTIDPRIEGDLRIPHGFRLLGLRQFRHPKHFGQTDTRCVVATPYRFTQGSPLNLPFNFTIEFSETPHVKLTQHLGLENKYQVSFRDGYAYEGATVEFGDPAETDVWGHTVGSP